MATSLSLITSLHQNVCYYFKHVQFIDTLNFKITDGQGI